MKGDGQNNLEDAKEEEQADGENAEMIDTRLNAPKED